MYIRTITFVYLFRMFTYFYDVEKNRLFDDRFQKHYKAHLNKAVNDRRLAWESVGLSINWRFHDERMMFWAYTALKFMPLTDKWNWVANPDKLVRKAHFLMKKVTTERITRQFQMMDSRRLSFDKWRTAIKKSV